VKQYSLVLVKLSLSIFPEAGEVDAYDISFIEWSIIRFGFLDCDMEFDE
jgi:hypothetical protein